LTTIGVSTSTTYGWVGLTLVCDLRSLAVLSSFVVFISSGNFKKTQFNHLIMLVHKLLVDLAPPFVTAKSWSIMDGRTGEILFGKCENDRREIASMTKIMTLFVVI
jgi:D-alanyl-D-alanine carboxypeptidase